MRKVFKSWAQRCELTSHCNEISQHHRLLECLAQYHQVVGEPEIQKLEKKWPESSRILDYILS